jgi:hypothetical protein
MNTHNNTKIHSSFGEKTMNASRLALFAALSLTLAGGACYPTAYDIDRVQPNYHDKDAFTGEWYARGLVVDKQYPHSMVFEGLEGDTDRIRWEITENRLLGFRSYAKVAGGESDNPGGQTLVVAFPIESHFDIRRQYNAQNGAENNVIEENTVDNPWWDRQYIRVDWSNNVASPLPAENFGPYVPYYSLAAYIQNFSPVAANRNTNSDPTYPWKVRVAPNYIETTIDAIIQPNINDCYNLGGYATGGAETYNCAGANVRVKFSFRKVDQTNDYQPLHFPDRESLLYGLTENIFGEQELCFEGDEDCDLQELWSIYTPFGEELCDPSIHNPDDCYQRTHSVFSNFGFFRTERFAYDREDGFTVTGRDQLANRWNIWKNSVDSDGNVIPHADRTPKTIVYHYSAGFPESLKGAVQRQADDWNVAFLDTIAELQGKTIAQVQSDYGTTDNPFRGYAVEENDCHVSKMESYMEMTKGQRDFSLDLMEHGLTLDRLGPGNIENACAVLEHYSMKHNVVPAFAWQQLGDLRYSFINWVAKPEMAGPLGYGPSAADPLTGELISGNANIYGASLDRYANWGADIVDLLNGAVSEDDIINGTHIREHVESVRARYREKTPMEIGAKFINMFDEKTEHMSDETYFQEIPLTALNTNWDAVRASGIEDEFLLTEEAIDLFGGPDMGIANGNHSDEAIERARQSNWKRDRVPPEMRKMGIFGSETDVADPNHTLAMAQKHKDRHDFFGRNNFCFFEDQLEPSVADLAYNLVGKTREEAIQIIREAVMQSVLAHEVGHTIGLRHNFEGSADPINFFPNWWGLDLGDDHRMSPNERSSELKYSSIMDYHQRFNSDWGGIGMYDKAAIKFGYGELVEVFDETETTFVPEDWADVFFLFSPDDMPYLLAGGDANDKVNDKYDEVTDELYYQGNNEVFMDIKELGIEPRPENLYKRRNIPFSLAKRQAVKEWFGLGNVVEGNGANVLDEHKDYVQDSARLLFQVPYQYCSDSYAWGGNLTCNRFDMGATSQEIVANAAEMYDFYHIFNTYTGARTPYWWTSYFSRLDDRTYQPMRNAFTYFYYYRRSTAQIWPFILDWALAAHDGLNFFGRVLQTPDTGTYCLDGGKYVPEAEATDCSTSFDLPLGDARQYESSYTDEYDYRIQNVGHMYDKWLALNWLTDTQAFFYRDFSNQLDRSAFSISYYRVFQDELIDLVKGMLTGDQSSYSAQIHLNGEPEVVFQPFVRFRDVEYDDTAGPAIQPSDSYILRNTAVANAMVGFSSTLDQTLDFAARSRINIVGSSNDPVQEGIPSVTFMDPVSYREYRAYAVDGEDRSIGYSLLSDAKEFVETGAYAIAVETLANASPLELPDAEAAMAEAELVLADKMHMIDLTRMLSDAVEFGN